MTFRLRAAFVLVAALLAGTPAIADTARPDYAAFKQGVFLRYLNARDDRMGATPRIGLSFGGRRMTATLDSGSTGVVIAARLLPDFDALPVIGPGKLTYTSSGRVMMGSWVMTPLTLSGVDGASVTTEAMPVLAVTRVACLKTARNCSPINNPSDIAMVGIGFGREGDAQSESTPDRNPLLRVKANGPQRRGYVLTSTGIHVGLTAANTRGGFSFIKLQRQEKRADWKPIPACISLANRMPAACGSMLVDTGVAAMFMTVPSTQAPAAPLPAGTKIAIRLGTAASSTPLYSFTSGDRSSPLAPSRIFLHVSDSRVFVNTSFHLLNGYDVLFDAEGGYAGFRPR